jgi:hypothetical protein
MEPKVLLERLNVGCGVQDFVYKVEASLSEDGVMNDSVKPKREVILKTEEITLSISSADEKTFMGEFHDQGDVKWTVIRGQLSGYNDTPCGLPAHGWPIGHPGSVHPQGVIGVFRREVAPL